MIKLVKLFVFFSLPLIIIAGVYILLEGKYYESFAMVELFPEKPLTTTSSTPEYSYSYRWIPWPSLLKSQVKLLKNPNFHKVIYKNLPNELKTYINKTYKNEESYKYISKNFKISPVLDSNVIEFYFYDKNKDKAEAILNAIVNIYIAERKRISLVRKKQLEQSFKKVEKFILKKSMELARKHYRKSASYNHLTFDILQQKIATELTTFDTVKNILTTIKLLLHTKYLSTFLQKNLIGEKIEKIVDELYRRYNKYIQKQTKKLANNLHKALVNNTYIEAIYGKDSKNILSLPDMILLHYHKLLELESDIGTINISIPVSVSEKPTYPNLVIYLLGALAIGFVLALSYFVFIDKEQVS